MKKILLTSLLCFSLFLSGIKVVSAVDYACQCNDGSQFKTTSTEECTSKCSTLKGMASAVQITATTPNQNTSGSQSLPNPLGTTSVNEIIARAIELVLSLVGSISLLMFVWGGLTWMTSAGSSDKIKKGRDIIVWSVIGLAIVFTSYILVKFVIVSIAG